MVFLTADVHQNPDGSPVEKKSTSKRMSGAASEKNKVEDDSEIKVLSLSSESNMSEMNVHDEKKDDKDKEGKKKISPKVFLQKKAVSAVEKWKNRNKADPNPAPVAHRTRSRLEPIVKRTRSNLAAKQTKK